LDDQVVFKQVLQAIRNQLTADQRHVIILRFLEGFSLLETAAIMGRKVGHVKVIQSRAIMALRNAIEPRGRGQIVSAPANRNLSEALRM
jgi:RNA polymerase sigma-70 factor (ECF subfamily)